MNFINLLFKPPIKLIRRKKEQKDLTTLYNTHRKLKIEHHDSN